MPRIGMTPFLSKPLAALMAFKEGLVRKFAAKAVATFKLPFLHQSFHGSGESYPWYRREQKRFYLKRGSYGSGSSSSSSSSPSLLSTSGIFSNCLPPSGSSKPPSSNYALLSFDLKQSSPSRKIEAAATYPKYVSPCLKSTSDLGTSIVRRMSTYRDISLHPPARAQMLGSRGFHDSCILLRKSRSDSGKDCKSTKEICRNKRDTCGDVESCKEKESECYPERIKCEVKKTDRKDIEEEKKVCPKSCVRGGKCIIAASKKPAKMVYGSTECPPPKLISPRTCPRSDSNEYTNEEPVCTEKAAARKLRKDACVPPPLPGPPTDPVPLCPCPPPPKLHPGPCPCPAYKEELKIKPTPPCPIKDKYPCCLPTYYCPPKEPCVRKLPCDQTKKSKS